MIVSQWWIYSESWAAYSDNIDGTWIALISWTVNTNIIGTYVIEYYQVDSAGNTGTAIRTVEVVDLDAPSVTAIGSTGTIIEAGSSYTDSWANWSDMVDGTGSIFVGAWWSTWSFASSGTVNTSQPRIYYIQYQKVDSAGNSDIKTRTVTVQDTTAPVISIIWSTEMIVSQWWIYSESWATWTDIVDGTGSALISWTVNTNIPGTYILYYSKTDNAGNNSVETRTISVIDTDVYLSPVWYMQNIVNPNSYTITWTLGSWINKVEISMVDANIGWAYTNVSTILGTIWSGEINLYTWSTYLIKLTPVDDLSTPTGPDQIITIIHTISGSVSTWSVQPIKRTGGWGWSSGRPPIVVTQSGSTTSTWDTTPWSQIIPTKKQEATTWSDEVVSIKIGKDGRIIVIRPWDKKPWTDGRVFAKDLDKMWTTSSESISDAWDESGKPLILKKYWIITPEMIENPTILEEYEPTWDSTPRVSNKKLDPRLQSTSRDQDSTQEISNSFYRKMIIELKTIFYSQT